jgi:hypothetical protein
MYSVSAGRYAAAIESPTRPYARGQSTPLPVRAATHGDADWQRALRPKKKKEMSDSPTCQKNARYFLLAIAQYCCYIKLSANTEAGIITNRRESKYA